jgi:glycosyltransferase involved in cell wall biosynthesis
MEAMASGCATVASNTGGNPELVKAEETGLLFPPADSKALAAALLRLCDDCALRERLARNATARIRSEFSVESSARRMGEIYLEFLQKRS